MALYDAFGSEISAEEYTSNSLKALDNIAPGISTMVNQTATPGESWSDTLQKLLPNLALTAQQLQLMQINIQRAKLGQPAIDVSSYSGAGVNVGLSPDTQKLVIYGGIALLAMYFFTHRRAK